MSKLLSKLNLRPLPEDTTSNPIAKRRQKILAKLDDQLAMAKSHISGAPHTCYKVKWKVNPETKIKERVNFPKMVKPWFKKIDNKYYFQVRYGNKPLQLQKNMYAIEVIKLEDLPDVIETLITAIAAGEIDELLVPIAPIKKSKK
jgi:hypothetical protein